MYDFTIVNHGSIYMVTPLTEAAEAWVTDNVAVDSWGWIGNAFACDPRMLDDLFVGIEDAGFVVVPSE